MTVSEIILLVALIVISIIHIITYIRYKKLLEYIEILNTTIEEILKGSDNVKLMSDEQFKKFMEEQDERQK